MLFKREPRKNEGDKKSRSGGSEFWHCRIVVHGKLHQFSTKTKDKNKARSIEAAFRLDKEKQPADQPTVPTLADFEVNFIPPLRLRVTPESRRYYKTHWRSLLDWRSQEDSPLRDLRLDKIGPAEIETFVQWRRKQKVSPTTINHNLRTLRRALHLAMELGKITKVPKIRLLPGEVQREYVLSEADVTRFAGVDGLISKLVPFLVDTGLRRREVCNLLWTNVSTAGTEIHITKGKTKAARRRIPLTVRAQKILADLPKNGDNVFTTRPKRGITHDWISHAFLEARRALELPADCVLHSCRHTFCTRLGEAGADAFAIQRLAGHSSITISQRYVHPSAARLDSVISLLDGKN